MCGEGLEKTGMMGLNNKNHGLGGDIKDPYSLFLKLDNCGDQCAMKKKSFSKMF